MKTPTGIEKPWEPASYDEHDISSIKALATGTANEGQQKRALAWILRAARTEEQSFIPPPHGDPHGRLDAFVEGKRSVGASIWTLIRIDLERWRQHHSYFK